MTDFERNTGLTLVGGRPIDKRLMTRVDIQDAIRNQVKKRQIRLKLFFEDFDKLRKKHCIDDKFKSALSLALYFLNLTFSDQDINILIDRYKLPGDLIRYQDFIENIDREAVQQTLQGIPFYSQQQEKITAQLLNYYKYLVGVHRIDMKSKFQDYDRTKCSHITKAQFGRVLNQLKLYPSEQIFDLVCKRYCDNGNMNQVNYVKFVNDVDNVQQMLRGVVIGIKPNEQVMDPRADYISDIKNLMITNTLYTQKKLDSEITILQDILKKIQAEVVMKRIRVRQFFIDFDTLRKNIITKDRFKRLIDFYNIQVSEKEVDIVCQYFRISQTDDRIRWMDFCDNIDQIFTTKGLEKDPLYRVNQLDNTVTLPSRKHYLQMTEQQYYKLAIALQKYKIEMGNKRVHLKKHFYDFDIPKRGYVTTNQFIRILDMFGLRADQDIMNIILKKYVDKGNLNQVNYYEFCRDIQFFDKDGKAISKTHADAFKASCQGSTKPQPWIYNSKPDDLNDLIAKLRKKIKEQRIRVSQFLRDFDKLRSGTITKEQLRLGFNMSKLPLSQKEFQIIVENFESPNKKGFIYWNKLCDLLDQVFTVKNLENTCALEAIPQHKTVYSYGKLPITNDQTQLAQQVKDRFRQFSRSNRLDIKEAFRNWDKLGRYKVSPKQFRQVLATINFNLSQDQFKAICKAYSSEDQKEVRYIDFLRDTKPFDLDYLLESNYSITKHGSSGWRAFPQNIQEALQQLRRITKINRLRYKEYFQDYDTLRKGIIKKNKFRSVISHTMKLSLEEEVLKWFQNYYQDPQDNTRMNYLKFLEDVDIVFTKPQLQKDPLDKPPIFQYGKIVPAGNLNQSQQQKFHLFMLRLGQVVRKHRLLLKPHFQDKDKAKSGKVGFNRMRAILDYNKLPLTQDQFDILCKRFSHQGVQFNYIEFDQVLKKYENLV